MRKALLSLLLLLSATCLRAQYTYLDYSTAGQDYVEFYSYSATIIVEYATTTTSAAPDLFQLLPDGDWRQSVTPATLSDTSFSFTSVSYAGSASSIPTPGTLFRLYLPLSGGVSALRVGVPTGQALTRSPVLDELPLVVLGDAVDPALGVGNAWGHRLGRELDIPVHHVALADGQDLESAFAAMDTLSARAYLIGAATMGNGSNLNLAWRIVDGITQLRAHHSDVPVLLIDRSAAGNAASPLSRPYERFNKYSVAGVHYVSADSLATSALSDALGLPTYNVLPPRRQYRELSGYDWLQRFIDQRDLARQEAPALVLIGNSITHYWAGEPTSTIQRGAAAWQTLTAGYTTVNMGMGWDRIENMLWRVDHGALDGYDAQHIFVLAGTNNLVTSDADTTIAAGVAQLAATIRRHQPNARIHVESILPRRNYDSRITTINADILQRITAMQATDPLLDYVDLVPTLTNTSGAINESYFSDGLHPNATGYARIAAVLRAIIEQ